MQTLLAYFCQMDAELENLQRLNTSLELQLAELRGKLKATGKELVSERERNQEARALFRHIRFDLHNASGLIQEPKELKDTVKVHAPPRGSCHLLHGTIIVAFGVGFLYELFNIAVSSYTIQYQIV